MHQDHRSLLSRGDSARIEVTRGEFEEMTTDLVERTETTVSLVLGQAGLSWDRIDRLLLVGGATRMPMIRRMLSHLSGREADASASPDEAVAHGAALYASAFWEADLVRVTRLLNWST